MGKKRNGKLEYLKYRTYHIEYRKKHKLKYSEYANNANYVLRKKILFLLGGKCNKCGFSDERALQIDHINGDGYKERRQGVARKNTIINEIIIGKKRYQLLCANCNWIKRFENNEI